MDLHTLLGNTAIELDIPLDLAEEAIAEYETVADWLAAGDSALCAYSPEIYPQGSFRIGTTVKPLRSDDFDIDLVCRLDLAKEQTTQRELKDSVGRRLRQDAELSKRLSARRRCWTLTYQPKFHLDVLPSIPDREGTVGSILLTDRDLVRWQHSNPIGYSEWFFSRMGSLLLEQERQLAAETGVDIAEVPRWRVRTPLQRAIQLLKRHRDVVFDSDPDNRPVSIIITTLAGHSYEQERDLFDALLNMVRRMPARIENRNGKWWIENPAHPGENFADKWNETPKLREMFLAWLVRLEHDLLSSSRLLTESEARTQVAKAFGIGTSLPARLGASVPAIGSVGHVLPAQWQQRTAYRCDVRGHVYLKMHGRKSLWPITDRATPKGLGLRFEAMTNAPAPFEVKWQVVNTGQEAAARGAHGLRGGFESGEGASGKIRWESTAYAGTHWVEAFVIKDGVCVARSGRKYVRIRS